MRDCFHRVGEMAKLVCKDLPMLGTKELGQMNHSTDPFRQIDAGDLKIPFQKDIEMSAVGGRDITFRPFDGIHRQTGQKVIKKFLVKLSSLIFGKKRHAS